MQKSCKEFSINKHAMLPLEERIKLKPCWSPSAKTVEANRSTLG
ncbi:hypothetical protein CKAH01_14355 [Colletotrichum kahawae]|uniref:Uncharacterized protein n=1 Tax=Colletotrichum kahawae TaxID=34407 RepID=A0AAD9YNX1_COLKA|nr:hypothetical protein CKAH01_14355 [Colletotrichum kahawae]